MRLGFHEEHGRVWDGQAWSVSWKTGTDPCDAAVAVFACGKEVVCPNLLAGDLAGKGYMKIEKPVPKKRASAQDAKDPPIWEGEVEGFGRLVILNKIDKDKQKFAALVNKSGQLTQFSAKSCKNNIEMGNKLMTIVAQRCVEQKVSGKPEIVAIRDAVRQEHREELDQLPPPEEPKPEPAAGKVTAGKSKPTASEPAGAAHDHHSTAAPAGPVAPPKSAAPGTTAPPAGKKATPKPKATGAITTAAAPPAAPPAAAQAGAEAGASGSTSPPAAVPAKAQSINAPKEAGKQTIPAAAEVRLASRLSSTGASSNKGIRRVAGFGNQLRRVRAKTGQQEPYGAMWPKGPRIRQGTNQPYEPYELLEGAIVVGRKGLWEPYRVFPTIGGRYIQRASI